MELCGRHYRGGQPVRVTIAAGRISEVTPVEGGGGSLEQGPWIAPGLVDLQVNGYQGQEFSSPRLTPQKVEAIVRAYEAFGVARCCPTLFTESFEVLRHSLKAIAAACESSPQVARRVAGIHLEGPYLSKEDGPRGAHPAVHCRPPDWEEFQRLQEASGGRIRILTMAVEFDDAPVFIRRVVDSGVLVAIGHTSASGSQIRAAVDAGARLSTHLGNGCHLMLPIFPNYLWDQLAEDRLAVSLIADGHHLPPGVIKTIVRVKTPQQCVLISDLSGWAGCPPGRYRAGHGDLEVLDNGALVVAGQRRLLAGASQALGTGVANVMWCAGLTVAEAIDMASVQSAQLLGLLPGAIEPGQPADLVLFHLSPSASGDRPPQFEVRCTVLDGEVVWGAPEYV